LPCTSSAKLAPGNGSGTCRGVSRTCSRASHRCRAALCWHLGCCVGSANLNADLLAAASIEPAYPTADSVSWQARARPKRGDAPGNMPGDPPTDRDAPGAYLIDPLTAGRIRGPPRCAHTQSASCIRHRSHGSALHVCTGAAARRCLHRFAVSCVKLRNIGSLTVRIIYS
jgi:hypothetical protein